MAIDAAGLEDFVERFTGDLGAALHAITVVVGDRLGLYRALADLGPVDAATLAGATSCDTRLVQEWLDAQRVSGYCHHSDQTGAYWLSPEQAAVLADPAGPSSLVGGMAIVAGSAKDEDQVCRAFRTGQGLGWRERHHDLFHGTERLNRPGYAADLVSHWIPAIVGLEDRLRRGAAVADLGCGHGGSTIVLAQTYPDSTVTGFDLHPASVDIARKRAVEAGVADRVRFEVAPAQDFPGRGYGLVCTLDTLHDMGDPPAAARCIHDSLDGDGTWLLVEPALADGPGDAGYPLRRFLAAASTLICTPAAQAQPGGHALGNRVPEGTLAGIAAEAGFTRFRRAAATPRHRVFEVRR